MSDPAQPDLPLPESHLRAKNEPSDYLPSSGFLASTQAFWAEYNRLQEPAPPEPGRILSMECVNALAARFETVEGAIESINYAWKEWRKYHGSEVTHFYSDWRHYGQNEWAVWEAKKAGVTLKKLQEEMKAVFPIKTPEEVRTFRLVRLRPQVPKLKSELAKQETGLAEQEKKIRELKEELDQVEKRIRELET